MYQSIRFYKILSHLGYKCLDGKYVNKRSKFLIMCDKGHVYERTAETIIKGRKCKICSTKSGGFNMNKPAYIYELISKCGNYKKIGITNDLKTRLERLRKDTPFEFDFIDAKFYQDGQKVWELEKHLKSEFQTPFKDKFPGYTEWRKI